MIDKTIIFLKRYSIVFLFSILLCSCQEEVTLEFIEDSIETSEGADIAINIPKAKGTEVIASLINETIENYIVTQSNFAEASTSKLSIEEAIEQFNKEYNAFKSDFPESSQKWEYFVDGEVVFHSEELICIALTTYLDTGGAHGNTNVKFFNFKTETGLEFSNNELINDYEGLSEIVQQKLMETLRSKDNNININDVFFGNDFKLPESLGFSDEGIIILYNPYEIASYSQGIIEFTIPYEDIQSLVTIY